MGPRSMCRMGLLGRLHGWAAVCRCLLALAAIGTLAGCAHGARYQTSTNFAPPTMAAPSSAPVRTAVPCICPIDHGRITSVFGEREGHHHGLDIAAPKGSPIHAAADGVVSFCGEKNGYGRTIVIDHGAGIQTLYAHLDSFNVVPMLRVRLGQCIGCVGDSGRANGFHLHYEIRNHDTPVDPRSYF